MPEFVTSMMTDYRKNGFLSIWTLWDKDNQCMIGTHSVPVLVDAYLKGFPADWDAVYAAIRDTLRNHHPNRRKENWDLLDQHGYSPFDKIKGESVSRTLECAYDDWCAAQMAAKLGKTDDAAFFAKRAQNWKIVPSQHRPGPTLYVQPVPTGSAGPKNLCGNRRLEDLCSGSGPTTHWPRSLRRPFTPGLSLLLCKMGTPGWSYTLLLRVKSKQGRY